MNDEKKYMLKKTTKGFLVKIDADVFYQLINLSFTVFGRKNGRFKNVQFWEKGIQWKDKSPVYLSRFIMNAKKGQIVDHINTDVLDNRRCNLRFVNERQNGLNRKRSAIFYGVSFCYAKDKIKGLVAAFSIKKRKTKYLRFRFCIAGLFLAAVAHDKLVCKSNSEEFAPLNFLMFKIPAFKKVLLNTDIKLLRSIYLGRKSKNTEKTTEKSKPEKKNTVYKNQFFFDFRV